MAEPSQEACAICLDELPLTGSPVETPPEKALAAFLAIDAAERANYTARLPSCSHAFHWECVRQWAECTNTCPLDRSSFESAHVWLPPEKAWACVPVETQRRAASPTASSAVTPCRLCGRSDHEDVLLLCDGCDGAFHTHCLGLSTVPDAETWFCPNCARRQAQRREDVRRRQRVRQLATARAQAAAQARAQAAARARLVANIGGAIRRAAPRRDPPRPRPERPLRPAGVAAISQRVRALGARPPLLRMRARPEAPSAPADPIAQAWAAHSQSLAALPRPAGRSGASPNPMATVMRPSAQRGRR